MTTDQLPGKTLHATRNYFGDYNLRYEDKVIFDLRYKPDLAVEDAGGSVIAGLWNSKSWEIHQFRTLVSKRFVVLRNGLEVLKTISHNWRIRPQPIQIKTANVVRSFKLSWSSRTISDELDRIVLARSWNFQMFSGSVNIRVAEAADPDAALPLIIFFLCEALAVENT